MNTHVQLDASAHLLVSETIGGSACPVGPVHLIQLEEYIQAMVLYDHVLISFESSEAETRVRDVGLDLLWQAGVLRAEQVPDLPDRVMQAKAQCLKRAMSILPPTSEKHRSTLATANGDVLRDLAWHVLRSYTPWEGEFRAHIPLVRKVTGTDDILTSAKKLGGAEYANCTDEDKIAIWYLLRTTCFVSLAAERGRPYKHNYYRTPFAQETYKGIRRSLLHSSELSEFMPDFGEINAQKLMDEGGGLKWHRRVPLFLSHILQRIDDRKQIEIAILELRDDPAAVRFRTHHKELLAKYGAEQAEAITDADVDNLLSEWRLVPSTVEVPATVDLPLWPTRVPGGWALRAKKMWLILKKHPLRIYLDLLDDNAKRSFLVNARKVFGHVTRQVKE